MFDVGQNDLDGALYSRSERQMRAYIPGILSEFETGLQVGIPLASSKTLFSKNLNIALKMLSYFAGKLCRNYTTRVPGISGFMGQGHLAAYPELSQHLGEKHQVSTRLGVLTHTTE